MRFRKSIRIGKGLRLNVSKSGVSASVGVPGLSATFGRGGTYLNTGIPGTGIYDRRKISGGRSAGGTTARGRSGTDDGSTEKVKIGVRLDATGNPVYEFEDGSTITDETVIRQIKRQPGYKEQLQRLREDKQRQILEATEKFVAIFRQTPTVSDGSNLEADLEDLRPTVHKPLDFAAPRPDPERIRGDLEAEARRNVRTLRFWAKGRLRDEYVNERLRNAVSVATAKWESDRAQFHEQEARRADELNKQHELSYLERKAELEARLTGDQARVDQWIEELLAELRLPVDFSVQFAYSQSANGVDLDVDLPEIEDVPDDKATILASGKLSVKKKTATERQHDYARCVAGLAFYFAGSIFEISPAIQEVRVSGYTQRIDKATGHESDDYVYSVKFDRPTFSTLNVAEVDPIEAFGNFEARINATKSMVLKTIEPYEPIVET